MTQLEALGLVALGLFAGTYGTMVGLGGGFLLVPAFLFLGYDARIAAGTSMAVVFANAVSGSFSYFRQRRVDVRSALIFAIAGVPGSLLGAFADQLIPQRVFSALFAALLTWVGIRLLATGVRSHDEIQGEAVRDDEPRPGLIDDAARGIVTRDFRDAAGVRYAYRYNILKAIVLATFAGFVASVFGIGGGLVQVPAMVYVFGFPTHVAAATSQVIIAITSLFGAASHALYSDVRWASAALVAVGAVIGAQIGARLGRRIPAGPLMRLLAIAVLFTAAKLIWDVLFEGQHS